MAEPLLKIEHLTKRYGDDPVLDDLSLEEFQAVSPVFEEDIYDAISMKTCVEKRMTIGAPGSDVMEKVIAENKKYLEEN